MYDDEARPKPNVSADLGALERAPTPEEFFLLSRITGQLAIREIYQISGLPRDRTIEALRHLHESGLIEIPGVARPEPARPGPVADAVLLDRGPEAPAPSGAERAAAGGLEEVWPNWPIAWEDFEPERSQGGALDPALARLLLYRHAHLELVDHYQFIGVARDAPRRAIRSAYFALSKRYHPDNFYGIELGALAPLVDDVFTRLNTANRVLTKKGERAAYDAALAAHEGAPAPGAHRPAGAERKREAAFQHLVRRAERAEAMGSFAEAAEAYKNAFSLQPSARCALRAAGLLRRCGPERLEESLALALAASRIEPDSVQALIAVGDAHEEKGDSERARLYYERARAVDPQNRVAARRLKFLGGEA